MRACMSDSPSALTISPADLSSKSSWVSGPWYFRVSATLRLRSRKLLSDPTFYLLNSRLSIINFLELLSSYLTMSEICPCCPSTNSDCCCDRSFIIIDLYTTLFFFSYLSVSMHYFLLCLVWMRGLREKLWLASSTVVVDWMKGDIFLEDMPYLLLQYFMNFWSIRTFCMIASSRSTRPGLLSLSFLVLLNSSLSSFMVEKVLLFYSSIACSYEFCWLELETFAIKSGVKL